MDNSMSSHFHQDFGGQAGQVNAAKTDQAIGQAVASGVVPIPQEPPTPLSVVGGLAKEQLVAPIKPPETNTVVEVGEAKEIEPEVEEFVEKVVREDFKLPEPIKDDQGNVVMADASARVVQDKIVVPLSPQAVAQSSKLSIDDSKRWLGQWIKRLVAMFGTRVVYRKEE